jgi:TPR repeat protein
MQELAEQRRQEEKKGWQQQAQAHLILGYMYMDGEGTKQDLGKAAKHMREAIKRGSEEAETTLGWMYNTGKYDAR